MLNKVNFHFQSTKLVNKLFTLLNTELKFRLNEMCIHGIKFP